MAVKKEKQEDRWEKKQDYCALAIARLGGILE